MQRSTTGRVLSSALNACLLLGLAAGCSNVPDDTPGLGRVTGQVTLEGEPVPGATLVFQPASGRPSMGVTDADGNYELEYSPSAKGAKADKHQVTISTYRMASPEEGLEGAPETIPAKYNTKARETPEMTVQVTEGSNEINFELEAGEVIQPAEMEDDGCCGGGCGPCGACGADCGACG